MKYRTYQLIGDCYTEPTYTEAPYWKSYIESWTEKLQAKVT